MRCAASPSAPSARTGRAATTPAGRRRTSTHDADELPVRGRDERRVESVALEPLLQVVGEAARRNLGIGGVARGARRGGASLARKAGGAPIGLARDVVV